MKPNKSDKNNKIKYKNKTGLSKMVIQPVYAVLIIFVLLSITYSNSFDKGLVHFDDEMIFMNMKSVSFENSHILKEAFSRDAWGSNDKLFYRPVQTLIFLILPAKMDSYNFLLLFVHILNTILLYFILECFFNEKKNQVKNLLLALIFGVHPLFTYMVNWIPALGDSLMTFFVLLSFWGFIKYHSTKHFSYLAIHIVSFFLAVFSKETAIVFPLVLAIIIFINSSYKDLIKEPKRLIIPVLFWIIIPAVYLIMRNRFIHSNNIETLPLIDFSALFHNIPVFFELITKFVFPIKLSLISLYSILRFVVGIVLTLLIIFFLIKKKEIRNGSMGLIWFMIFLGPTLIFSTEHYDYLEHRAYLPIVGMLILLSSVKIYKYENLVYVGLIFIFLIVTFSGNKYFQNPISFYDHVIGNQKNVAMAYMNRGFYKDNSQNFKGALADYNEAIKLDSGYIDAWINRGNLKAQKLNNLKGGESDLEKALNLVEEKEGDNPEKLTPYLDVINNLAIIKQMLNDADGAISDYRLAIEINPEFSDAWYNLGVIYYEKLKDFELAIQYFDRVIEIDPGYYKAFINRGLIKEVEMKMPAAAIEDYNKAIEIKPDFAMAWFNRGMCWSSLNQLDKACFDWNRAKELGHKGASQMMKTYCD
ncbi:MAG: tetratricopeptide repeat protein [Bacteroidales bacterium]|nr:tetratricopeptide repeat protein [Bacteroidales bacterium]